MLTSPKTKVRISEVLKTLEEKSKLLGMRFNGNKEEVAIKRTILGSPDCYTEYTALKKRIEVPEPVKKAKTHGLGLTPKSLLGHSNISASHS